MRRPPLLATLRDASLRRLVVAFGAFSTVEAGSWIGLLVYAHGRGGVFEVGVVGAALLVPAALLAPLAAPLADRFRRDRVLAAGYAAQAAGLAAVASAIASAAEPLLVYAAAALLTAAATVTRPAVRALLPALARRPADLSTSNAAADALENLGGLVGPLGASALLLAAGPASVFVASSAVMTAAALGIASLRLDPALTTPLDQATPLRASIAGGVGFLGRDLDVLLLVSCVAAPALLLGAVEVLVVAVATEQLGQGSHGVGILNACLGVGGIFGAGAALCMTGRQRLARALCIAGLVAGLALAGIAVAGGVPGTLACLFTSGIGLGFGGVVGTTLIQRASPDRFRASVFGVLEGLETASLAIGALLVSALSTWLDLPGTLLAIGSLVPLVMLLSAPRLRAVDAGAQAPGECVLSALRRDPIFAPLGLVEIEQVANRASVLHAASGEVITRQGEIGDRYYCILAGDLEVRVDGQRVRTLGRGDSFGEIALLHAVPRTATVATRGPATLIAVEGEDFLETVTRRPRSLVEAEAGRPTPNLAWSAAVPGPGPCWTGWRSWSG